MGQTWEIPRWAAIASTGWPLDDLIDLGDDLSELLFSVCLVEDLQTIHNGMPDLG